MGILVFNLAAEDNYAANGFSEPGVVGWFLQDGVGGKSWLLELDILGSVSVVAPVRADDDKEEV